MASKTTICGICDLRHITKPALVWCSECDEGLCVECKEHHGLSKGTRSHNTVTISEYEKLPSSVLEVTHFCSEHNEKYQIYCKKHELPCCHRCVIKTHNECKDITALDDVINDVKTSNAFFEIEHMLVEVYENIQRILEDRRENLERLKTARQRIEKEIQQTRMDLNAQLDKLQASILKELSEVEANESKKIQQFLQSLEEKATEIGKYHENLANIKQHASDLQIFLALKQMGSDVLEKDAYISNIVKSDKLCHISLSCEIKDTLKNSLGDFQKCAEIIVKTNPTNIVLVRKKEQKAQINSPSNSIDNLSCHKQKTVYTRLDHIRGCTLLPDGRMVFSSYLENCVKGFKRDGSKDFDISLKPAGAFDLTYIQDTNNIAVTSGEDKRCISIIDIEDRKVKKTIPVATCNSGIVSRNNTLIYCAGVDGLRMINLSDLSVSSIVKNPMSEDAYVATFGDKLFYTNSETGTVTCCDLQGTMLWEFKDESILESPFGVSVDNKGNLYVAGSHNIVVISRDGQHQRELLSGIHGLDCPHVVHYARLSNQLLVANKNKEAFLFSVE